MSKLTLWVFENRISFPHTANFKTQFSSVQPTRLKMLLFNTVSFY